MRLINEQTAFTVLSDYYHHNTDTQHKALREALGRVETVDAVPVVHGQWIKSNAEGFVCSVCLNGYKNQPTLMGVPMFEYCPVCGARMDR